MDHMTWLLRWRRQGGPETIALLCGDDVADRPLSPIPSLDYQTLKMVGPGLKENLGIIETILRVREGYARHLLERAGEYDGNAIDRLSRIPNRVLIMVRDRLAQITRRYDALSLAEAYFPGLLKKHRDQQNWTTILLDVLKYFQRAKWLPLDNRLIEYARNMYGEEDDVGLLESFLTCIPVEPLFVNGWEMFESYDAAYPCPGDLLFGLFVDENILAGREVTRKWGITTGEMDPEVNARNIRQAPPGIFKPGTPPAWLPDVVSLYRQETGFRLIDRPVATEMYYDEGPQDFPWTELAELRREWNGGVRELVARRLTLEDWLEDDGNARQMIALLLELNKEYGGAK